VTMSISTRMARRLALARAGLLKPEWTGPVAPADEEEFSGRHSADHESSVDYESSADRPSGRHSADHESSVDHESSADQPSGRRGSAHRAPSRLHRDAHAVIDRFGYLQLDTVSVAGARSHAIVLMSRLPRATPAFGESLLRPGEPLFEYWGHEVSWMPLRLYPAFGWRRRRFRRHPWWGDVIGSHPRLAREILRRVRDDGPLKSSDLEGKSGPGWWDHKPAKNVAVALWSAGELAVRERRAFQRTFDLPERVIPDPWRDAPEPPLREALKVLLLHALEGHGWATTGTLARTWRLRLMRAEVDGALQELAEAGLILPCDLLPEEEPGDRAGAQTRRRPAPSSARPPSVAGRVSRSPRTRGWIRPADLELAARLEPLRPGPSRPVLLSPFDPLLWERERVERLFGFQLTIEIFLPAARRTYGYYCLPVLAGERLIARADLKADRREGALRVLTCHVEPKERSGLSAADARALVRAAVERYARQAGLAPPAGSRGDLAT